MATIVQRREVQEFLDQIGSADILIGIPSYNNARTIGHVVRAVQAGLAKYFPDQRAAVVNSDGGSRDGTMEVVRSTRIEDQSALLLHHRVDPVPVIATPYTGVPGKGSAFRAIFEIADALKVRSCAVVDSDLRSITPEWVELLCRPVLDEAAEFVAPLYHRHKYDGTITNSIVYPLTRALYGKCVRQPIGGDFGFSGRLAGFYLAQDVWDTDVARFGVDIWMTTTAIANGFKIAESFLGAKIHDTKDPGSDLSAMLYQVVSAAFDLMEVHHPLWKEVKGAEPVPSFGFTYTVGLEQVNVNVGRMLNVFREGLRNLGDIWTAVLGSGDLREVERLGTLDDRQFRFPRQLWTRVIYDYAIAYHQKRMSAEHLLKSLTPLYLGKTASFVLEAETMGQEEAEAEIEKLCLDFESAKGYLVTRWK